MLFQGELGGTIDLQVSHRLGFTLHMVYGVVFRNESLSVAFLSRAEKAIVEVGGKRKNGEGGVDYISYLSAGHGFLKG
ncbi:hypothetical protein CHUAL_007147 [Chamberlinius hualienensis]